MENVRTAAADTVRLRTPVTPTQASNPTPSPQWSPPPAPVQTNSVEAMPPAGRPEQPRSRRFQPRHRVGASVDALIGPAPSLADTSVGRMPISGAHRDPPRTGRHRAASIDPLDRLARRRTIGGRPDRGVGRTAL